MYLVRELIALNRFVASNAGTFFSMKKLLNMNFENLSLIDDLDFYNDSGGFEEEICGPFQVHLHFFHTYYIPLIIIIGLIGNLLSCVVFLTTYLKMRSSSYYLAALAMADFGFLSVLLVVHCSFANVMQIYHREGWCQTFVYISSVSSTLSVWFIVAFTVERFIAVQYPLQRPHMCTVSRAKLIVLILTVIAMFSQSYVFWTAGMQIQNNEEQCEIIPEYYQFMKVVNFIDSILTLIGPFILIVVMNTMIARNIFLFSKRMQSGSLNECLANEDNWTEQKNSTQTASSNRRPGSQTLSQKSNIRLSRKQTSNNKEQLSCIHIKSTGLMSAKNQQSISKMLLLISTVFILLNLPSYAIRLYVYFFYVFWEKHPPPVLWCMQQFAMLLFYTNYSINFSLYAMYGITFRRCLWQLIRNNFKKITRKPCELQ